MRNFKKVIAAGLALLMLALSVNVSFAAESYTDKEAVVVAKVNAAGIMTGTDKGFEPSKTLTRAEAAAIFVRMKGISEGTVKQNNGATLFTDVAASHWAAGYINVASNYGIIKGVGANMFAPEKEVTVAEFYTMAIRALNAGQLVEAEGTWPTNYVNFAIENDLAEDVQQIYTAASTRMTAATIVANTLEAEMWKKQGYKSNGEVEFRPSGETILDSLNIVEYTLAKISGVNTKDSKATVTDSRTTATYDALSNVKFNDRANLASAKAGLKYTVWYDKSEKEVLGFWVPDEDTSTVRFTDVKKFNTAGDKVTFIIDGDEKEYDLHKASSAVDTKLYLNGYTADDVIFNATNVGTNLNNVFGTAYVDSDNKVTAVYAEVYRNMEIVKEVKDERIIFESETDIKGSTTGVSTIVYDKDDEYTILKDGKELKFEDIEEGDVLFYYVIDGTNDKYFINIYEETVEGKVSAVNSTKKTVKIGGTVYDCDATLPNAGAEIKAYLAEDGDIAMYEIIEDETNFAIISAIKKETSSVDGEGDKVYARFTDTKGSLTDWTEVKLSACVSSLQADSAWVDDTVDDDKYDLLGTLVEYSLDGGKAVVSTVVAANNGYAYKENGQKLVKSGSSTYYLTDSTIVLELEVEDSSKKFSKTLMNANVVDVEDLDDLAAADIKAYGDIDDIYVGVIVLNSSNIKADKNWGVVLSKSNWSDDDDATNYNALYEVQLKGSTEAVELVSDKALTVGGIYEIATGTATIDGDEVAIIKTAKSNDKVGTLGDSTHEFADKAKNAVFVGKKNDNNTVSFVTLSSLTVGASDYTDTYKLADDVIVVKDKDADVGVAAQGQTPANAHLDLAASKFSSLVELGAKATETISQGVADKAKSVGTVYTYTDGDVEEIIAIIYID